MSERGKWCAARRRPTAWPGAGAILAGLALHSASVLAFSLGGGLGGTIVYDPSNHLETAISAGEAVKQTALQVQAEAQRIQGLEIAIRQITTLPQATVRSTLADWDQELAVLRSVAGDLGQIYAQLDSTRQRFAGRLRAIAALGLTPDAYFTQAAATGSLQQGHQQALLMADQQSLAFLSRAQQSLRRLQPQIPASSGLQQSLQTTNQYLDLLAGQTAQLLQLTAAAASASAYQQSAQAADGALAAQREAQRLATDVQRITQQRAQLRSLEASQGWGLLRPLP